MWRNHFNLSKSYLICNLWTLWRSYINIPYNIQIYPKQILNRVTSRFLIFPIRENKVYDNIIHYISDRSTRFNVWFSPMYDLCSFAYGKKTCSMTVEQQKQVLQYWIYAVQQSMILYDIWNSEITYFRILYILVKQ